MKLGRAILSCTKILIGSVLLLLVLNPTRYADLAQTAILQEYINVYCLQSKEARADTVKYGAQGALMSRLTIRANLGSVALLEYAKCKVTN